MLSKIATGKTLSNFCLASNVSKGSFCFVSYLAAFAIMLDFSQAFIFTLWEGRKRRRNGTMKY